MAKTSNRPFDFGVSAEEYDAWYETPVGQVHDRVQKADVRRLLGRGRPGERLLDIGCGTGHWSRFFSSLEYTVVGIDIAEEMILVAKKSRSHGIFAMGDACSLPFKDRTFDAVTAMATLEFVSNVSSALKEMFRCVKSGSCVLVGTLNRLAPLNRRRLAEGRQPYASGRLFAPNELRHLLDPFGHVRMLASVATPSAPSIRRCGQVKQRLQGKGGSLSGAFIVAEVLT